MIIDCGSLWRYVTACLWLGIVTDEGYPNSKVATSGPSGRLQICWMPPRWETVLQCGSSRALTMTELRITSLCLGMVTRNLTSRTIPTIELLPCSVDLRWKNFWGFCWRLHEIWFSFRCQAELLQRRRNTDHQFLHLSSRCTAQTYIM